MPRRIWNIETSLDERGDDVDVVAGRRGGLHSHRSRGRRTWDQLYEEAKRKGVKSRSRMSKTQLSRAVGR